MMSHNFAYTWQLKLKTGEVLNQFTSDGTEQTFKTVSPGEMESISLISGDDLLPTIIFRLNGRTPIYFRRVTHQLTCEVASCPSDKVLYAVGYEDQGKKLVYLLNPEDKSISLEVI